jgi:hypothetical protein
VDGRLNLCCFSTPSTTAVQAEEVYCLLRDNYVEDDDCTFR